MSKRLYLLTGLFVALAILLWQLLFHAHPFLDEVLWEIHTIFLSTLLVYFAVSSLVTNDFMDFIKVVFKTVFKVWLVIFISFSMAKPGEQAAFLLTTAFILGYLEGLLDIDKWMMDKSSVPLFKQLVVQTKRQKTLAVILLMSLVHIVCAVLVLLLCNVYHSLG